MIIHNEETLEEAILLVGQGPIKYSDEYSYRTVTSERQLRGLVAQAFGRKDIAVVAPVGQERSMEVHSMARRAIKTARAEAEKGAIKQFLAANPEVRKAKTVGEAMRIFHAKQKGVTQSGS